MIKRLDVKFVLTLIITSVVPIVASLYLVTEAVQTSLGVGLNRDISESLAQSVTVYKNYIESIKSGHDSFMLRLTDSARLVRACQTQDEQQIEKVLRSFIRSAEIKEISLELATGPLVVQYPMDDSRYRSVTRNTAMKHAFCKNAQVVFGVKREITENFKQAAHSTETYEAIYRAPRDYLTQRVIMIYGIFLGLIVIISVWQGVFWTRRLTRRLHTLNLATKDVAEGNMDVRVDPGGQDEVAELINSFNTMVDEIESTRARIQYLQKISTWQEIARRLAHEIKNPLTPIQLAAQQLKNKYDENDPRFGRLLDQSVDIIEEEVQTLKRLVTDFSSFAKLPQIAPVPMDVGEFLRDCEATLEIVAQKQDLTLLFHFPEPGLMVSIDSMMMKRVVDNLIRNAAEAMANADVPDPTVIVRVEKIVQSNAQPNEVAIRFEDNGPGILPEHHPSLFEPYFTTKEEGTGLGLAISKKIVLEHNGVIWIDDEQKNGACFVVQLPMVKPKRKVR